MYFKRLLNIKTINVVKKLFFHLLNYVRVQRLSLGRSLQPLIVFAHRVLGDSQTEPARYLFKQIIPQALGQEIFIQRLKMLQRYWRFLPMDEAVLAGTRNGGHGVAVLSFDDGYADLINVVQPVLKKLDIPMTVYMTTAVLDQRELLWFDQVFSSIAGAQEVSVTLEVMGKAVFPLHTKELRVAAATKINALLTNMYPRQRLEAINELRGKLGPGLLRPMELYLSRQDLEILSQSPGITIGSHTLSHPNLTLLSTQELEAELRQSKEILEEVTGREIKHLSYPSGIWNETVADMAKKCGYTTACSTGRGIKGQAYALRRVNLGWWNEAEFAVRTSRLFW